MPGRSELAGANDLGGVANVWRPIAIVPGAAVNATGSLVVPFAVLLLIAGLDEREVE
ncbi:hypothetical protein [Sphingomonas sp. PL20]|uniref:hypothetical protein n=1 Tax=Sphingomonas sp. PL20 TaxID=2760712 RepID=UPI001AE2443D|nr:hypothetical protein [Cutibacterium sp.]